MGQFKSYKVKCIFLLLVFILLKIGIAHSLTHAFSHDEINDCEQCVLILESNKINPYDGPTYSNLGDVFDLEVIQKPITLLYENPLFREHDFTFFFNKPPPSL